MPDEEPIPPSPPPAPGPELGPKSSATGLPSNVAAALACIPLIGGIIFYIVEKHDGFVRFYAIPGIGGLLVFLWARIATLIHSAFLVVWIVATIKAFTGVRWDIPYIGP